MLILKNAGPALCLVTCACSAPPFEEVQPRDITPVGCAPTREERAASSPEGFALDTDPWCEGCPFDDQASLVSPNTYDVALHSGAAGTAILLADAQWQSGQVISSSDPVSGWSSPLTVPLGDAPVLAPTDEGFPYILSDWHGILRLREPSGVEENISCPDESFVPAGIDARDGELQVLAGWFDGEHLRASVLTRPVDEPERPWEDEFVGVFDAGPMRAARGGDGEWLVVGMKGVDGVLLRKGEAVPVAIGASPFEDGGPAAFELVVGESFAAVVAQQPSSLVLTLDDGKVIGFPTPSSFTNPACDGSTACGGRCVFKQHTVGRASAFAAGRFLFVAFVETTVDATKLLEDVYCDDVTLDLCDCREVVERDESSSNVVFARFDATTLDGERVLTVPIPFVEFPTMRARAVQDRVVFALRSDAQGETRLGSLPLSALQP